MDPQTRHAAIRRGFRDNEIDAAVLPSLTDEGLKDLGIASVGRRRRLLGAIAGPKPKWQSGCDRAVLGWQGDETTKAERVCMDSPLEGNGFEISVPRQVGSGFEASVGPRRAYPRCFNSLDAPRDRFAVDSPLEGTVCCELVSEMGLERLES